MARRAWLALAIGLAIAATLMAVGGGVRASAGGFRVSAQSPRGLVIATAVASLVWLTLAWRARTLTSDAGWLHAFVQERSSTAITLIAVASAAVSLAWHSYSPSGADSSGYLSQAVMWAHAGATRTLGYQDPLVSVPGWPLTPAATTPLGWRPGQTPGWQVPTYAPGLPLLMTVPYAAAGLTGAATVIAGASGVAVWATGRLALVTFGAAAALAAALAMAVSPVLLGQSFQVMSDLPVTSAWMLCLWWTLGQRSPLRAGLAAGIAALIRPNLAPLAIVPLVAIAWPSEERPGRWRDLVTFAAPVAVAGSFVGWLQWHWYGSPLTSGYGATTELFALANVWPNLSLYAGWLWQTHPLLCLAPFALLPGMTNPRERSRPWVLIWFASLAIAAYLVYGVFESWHYLRFLLPAIAIAAVLVGGIVGEFVHRCPPAWRPLVLLVIMLAILAQGVATSRALGVFAVADQQSRARLAGSYLASALPPEAVVISGEQSGAARLTTGRPIVRWETLSPEQLTAALAVLGRDGIEVWWLLDQWEEPLVRARLGSVPEAALDWPPAVESGDAIRARAWRVSDRERYLRGERMPLDRLRQP